MSMRRSCAVLPAVLLLCALPALRAQQAAESADEAAVRTAVMYELDGWAKFDAKQIAACHTETVTWQNPFGVRIRSRARLEAFLTNLFNRPGYRAAVSSGPKITDIHVLSPMTAVVWSEEKSEGQIDDTTHKPMAPRYSHYMEVLVKQDGKWLISDSMIMDQYPQIPAAKP